MEAEIGKISQTIIVGTNMEKKQRTKAEAGKKAPRKGEEQKQSANAEAVGTRGRIFEGIITKKFPKRIVMEFERMVYIRKYERYARLKTKLHARVPEEMEKELNIGDLIKVRECRPLSKIIHFMVIQKLKDASEAGK